MKLTPTETALVAALENAEAVVDVEWRHEARDANSRRVYELVELTGKSEASVKKAVKSLTQKGLVAWGSYDRCRGRMHSHEPVRLRLADERAKRAKNRDHRAAAALLEDTLQTEQGSDEVNVLADLDGKFGMVLHLGGLTEEQCRAVLTAVNAVAPDALKGE